MDDKLIRVELAHTVDRILMHSRTAMQTGRASDGRLVAVCNIGRLAPHWRSKTMRLKTTE